MKARITTLRRPAGGIAVVAVVAALAPGLGLAAPQSQLRVHQPEIISGLVAPAVAQSARVPEIVAGIVPLSASVQHRTGPAVKGENYYARGLANVSANIAASGSSGFPWGDASLGVGVAFALSVLAAGALLVTRRYRGTVRTS